MVQRSRTRLVVMLLLLSAPTWNAELPAQALSGSTTLLVGVGDAVNGAFIPGALITIDGLAVAVRGDSMGRARIPHVPKGVQTVRVRRIGYAVATAPVRVSGADSMEVIVLLAPVAHPLRGMEITEEATSEWFSPGLREFERRRRTRPFGHFVTEPEIRSAVGSDLRNFLLPKIPGLRIEPKGPSGNALFAFSTRGANTLRGGLCQADVYLDGVRVISGEVSIVPLSMLGGVEYYAPGTVPVEYKRLGESGASRSEPNSACGVLLLWTAW